MMKLGFIGFGKSTNRYHMPFIDAAKQFEVTGYYTRGTRQFDMPYPNNKPLIQRFDSIDDLLNSNVEIIVVATPASSHYQFAKQAILAGKHVIVEKPFCGTLEQAKELFQLAKQANVKITPYQNRRYDSDFLTIKTLLTREDLGQIMEIESNHTHYRTDGAVQTGNKYDGSVYGHAVHFLDQIVSLYGEPDEVIYDIANQKNYYIGKGQAYQMTANQTDGIPEDYYDIKLIYGNLRIRVRFSQLIIKEPPRWIVNATNATIEKYQIDQQERDLKQGIFLDHLDFGKDTPQGICTVYFQDRQEKIEANYQHYTQFYKDFKASIENNTMPPVSEKEALIVMNIMEGIVNQTTYNPLFK
ncbi:Gfo/Idh/MocA family oxidoreductase [Vibrio sp. S17_S38]|uniref:Gfo/Idh/MocA family oxidoreductase n=1 Tax=Vibrio sp. S17_S38 TaxID=2720229 RepID=UPI0016808818|nr:Gfo/Idh/MocA family oxidoreductase [Vibrio sp. S17_S38]MBD1573621.1 Gfo/Idh/MocA family oxidoreductase [Vibrio sp. S17_S38]